MKKIMFRMSVVVIVLGSACSSCHYLDIVPDNVATVDYAFRMRSQAEKYLFTCYSYLPGYADWGANPGLLSGDEVWFFYPYRHIPNFAPPVNWEIARGNQGVVSPYLNYWDGNNGGKPMFQGIRDCNTFLENIDRVPDMNTMEKDRWKSEVMFLKAYYHWFLLRMYGPVPIKDRNNPVSAGVEDVKVYREPVDSCFEYITALIDSSLAGLPDELQDPVSELGRLTKPIALSVKARILINAASPLFNGNPDYASFTDNQGRQLFSTDNDPVKWERAAAACKEAIDACQSAGYALYHFTPSVIVGDIGPEITTEMSIRNALCEKWNPEVIWGSTNSMANTVQNFAQANIDPNVGGNGSVANGPHAEYAPTLKIAEMFYTKNGVPIDEDKTWDYAGRYSLDTAKEEDRYYINPGYVTAALHFDREPRFYADLGFDGGVWYGQGRFDDDDTWWVQGRSGGFSGKSRDDQYSITGYYAKKLVNYLNVIQTTTGVYQVQRYPWPIMRLADLYLYYSEALNEVNGPSDEALSWINAVRERAGIPSVQESWTQFSVRPGEYQTKDGLRRIIHRERMIEMAFEGDRYWDLRRWKEAEIALNQPVKGWSISQALPQYYYIPVSLFGQTFKKRDYLWPIPESALIANPNLVQNPGW